MPGRAGTRTVGPGIISHDLKIVNSTKYSQEGNKMFPEQCMQAAYLRKQEMQVIQVCTPRKSTLPFCIGINLPFRVYSLWD